jgi:isopenicillin N synthase-like dioxygenase
MDNGDSPSIPLLDLAWAEDPKKKPELLQQLHSALFDVGFLYIKNHGVPQSAISDLTTRLPALFNLPEQDRAALSKMNSPHFLGYSGFAEETTLGKQDLREQFDYGTELPVVHQDRAITKDRPNETSQNRYDPQRDFTKLYWRLRGPNQWPSESSLPGFKRALLVYHDALQELSYRFVHLIEEAFEIPVGTFDHFFGRQTSDLALNGTQSQRTFLPPQHRLKLLKYPPSSPGAQGQGVGAHKDSSGWLTFLYQVNENLPGLEVLSTDNTWLSAHPVPGTFVVNFGNAFEAATEGAVKATTHRVIAPPPESDTRYSIPFFQGLPLDMTVSEVRSYIPPRVRRMRKTDEREQVSAFLDPRWDSLGESQLRKWIRSHRDVGLKWYGKEIVDFYTA